jgi:hypothetical protein
MRERRIWAFTFGLYVLIAIISWVGYLTGFVSPQAAIGYTVLTPLALGAVYALRRFVLGTSPSRWRVLFIFFGTFCIGGVLWVVFMLILRRVFGLDADFAALISLPAYPLGAYLGDKLGKRRNYMPWV